MTVENLRIEHRERKSILQIMLMVLHGTYGGTRLYKWNDMKEVKEMCKLQKLPSKALVFDT